MQNLYREVTSLDRRCSETFCLSEEVMMEHAAAAIAQIVRERFPKRHRVFILCGSGNNGADGLAVARLLAGDYEANVYLPFGAASPLCHVQRERIEKMGLKNTPPQGDYDIIIDALFGSGLSRAMGPTAIEALDSANVMQGFKIACDVPSGLSPDGTLDRSTFRADLTVTMALPMEPRNTG